MFGKRTQDINGVANEKWHELVETLGSTEAVRRASGAWDVLAGRPTPTRAWPVLRAAALGVAAGWVASEFYRRRQPQIDQTIEQTMDKVGNELRGAKHQLDERIAKAKATPGSPMDKAKAAVGRTNASNGMTESGYLG
ncbi:hypothetical protein Rhe02_66110 [Rhizocola hellebori]|uniref:YtxH domain-containing protein n=1 Tax=Rhizocola hellebori TaxID=1392758 RepID=A0A8J3VIM1_9ACTN|nr:hypothetical protein [Rhizocola hellebori]GIH08544.1 hypothetical protein Rhe02_66110 [Rhizocola hellebori]